VSSRLACRIIYAATCNVSASGFVELPVIGLTFLPPTKDNGFAHGGRKARDIRGCEFTSSFKREMMTTTNRTQKSRSWRQKELAFLKSHGRIEYSMGAQTAIINPERSVCDQKQRRPKAKASKEFR